MSGPDTPGLSAPVHRRAITAAWRSRPGRTAGARAPGGPGAAARRSARARRPRRAPGRGPAPAARRRGRAPRARPATARPGPARAAVSSAIRAARELVSSPRISRSRTCRTWLPRMIRAIRATPSAASGDPSMLDRRHHEAPRGRGHRLPGRAPADGVQQRRAHRRVGVEDQPLLDREVVEDRLLHDPGALGDLHHADRVEPALGEQFRRGVDDARPGLLPAQLPAPGPALGARPRRRLAWPASGAGRRRGGRLRFGPHRRHRPDHRPGRGGVAGAAAGTAGRSPSAERRPGSGVGSGQGVGHSSHIRHASHEQITVPRRRRRRGAGVSQRPWCRTRCVTEGSPFARRRTGRHSGA